MLLAFVLAGSLGGVDTLGKVSLNGLDFKGPTHWQKQESDEHSLEWMEPESGAQLAVSVFPVDPVRPAKACVKQMVEALGTEGFNATNIGAQPASKKIVVDYLGDEKTDANKVSTTTLIGCNGRKKWVLTWSAKTSEGRRFGPILKRVMDSITYRK